MAGSSDGRLDAQYDRAMALSKRYEGSGDLRDLDAAIEAWERLAHLGTCGSAGKGRDVKEGVPSR